MKSDARTRRASRHALRIAAALVGAALLVAVLLMIVRPGWVASALRGQVEELASRSLGRPVTIASLDARLFPKPGAELFGFKIEGAVGEPPIIQADNAVATVQLWPLIKSFGREVRLGTITLDRASLNLVRRVDGSWNYEDLQSSKSSQREVWIAELRIRDGEVQLTDRQAKGGAATVAVDQIDLDLKNIGPGERLELEGEAAVASAHRNLDLELAVDPLPLGDEVALAKPAVSGELRLKALSVQAFRAFLPPRAAALFTGGLATGQVRVSTNERRHYAVDGDLAIDGLRLRGEPASGAMAFRTAIDPARASDARIEITSMSMKGPGVDLAGTATVATRPTSVQFAVKGPLLDLDHLLSVLPEDDETADGEAAKQDLLPSTVREKIGSVKVHGTLAVDEVRSGKLVATGLQAQGLLERGVLVLQQGRASVFGGDADLSNSRVDLNQRLPEWSLRAKVSGMELAQAFSSLSGHQALKGKATLNLMLDGAGATWAEVRQQLTGDGMVELREGALTTADLGAQIAPVLVSGLQAIGGSGPAGVVEKVAEGTELRDLRTGFSISEGFLRFSRPVSFRSRFGSVELGGRVALDQTLDLDGKVSASPEFVSKVSGGAVKPRRPVPVPLSIDGTLRAPAVRPGSPGKLLQGLVESALPEPVQKKADEVREQVKSRARRGLNDALDRLRR